MKKKYKNIDEGKKHYQKMFFEMELGKDLIETEKKDKKIRKKQ